MDNQPMLAAGLICGRFRDRATTALASLLKQTAVEDMEVVVVDCAAAGAGPIPGSSHPRVRVLEQPGNYDLGSARVDVVEATSAPLVWFLEEHSIAFPRCAEALIRSHADDWAAVAPEVRPFPKDTFKSRLLNRWYDRWVTPTTRGPVDHLMGHNVSYKRSVLEQYSDDLDKWLNCEYFFHRRLHGDGHRLTMEPDAGIHHALEQNARHIARGVMMFERLHTAHRRNRASGASTARILVATALGPLIRPLQILRQTARRHPRELAVAAAGLPVYAWIAAGSSLGRLQGWLAGAGNAATVLGRIELDIPRLWWPEEPEEPA